MVVLSFGLLGLAGLQARALRASVSSVQRTQAVVMTQYILDLMRVDRVAALRGDYNTTGGLQAPLCTVPTGSAAQFAAAQVGDWLDIVKSGMGQSGDTTTCAAVLCSPDGLCTVNLRWDDRPSGGLADQSLSVSTRL